MNFFQMVNTKEDILKNVCKQTVDRRHWLGSEKNYMEVNGYRQLYGYTHSSEYRFCVFDRRKHIGLEGE